jgi:hypothetical protein
MTIWILGGLAFADWVTPHPNIGGLWQYVVLWLIIFGLNMAYAGIFMAAIRDTREPRDVRQPPD